jgi:hypothetical protein
MPPKMDSNGGGGDADEHVFRPAQKAKNAAPVAAKTANGVLERIPADRKDVVSYLLPFYLVAPSPLASVDAPTVSWGRKKSSRREFPARESSNAIASSMFRPESKQNPH